MSWLDDAYDMYNKLKFEEPAPKDRLSIKSESDIPPSLRKIKSVFIGHPFKGDIVDTIRTVLRNAWDLEELCINTRENITWSDICALDLSRIKDLTFVIDAPPSGEILAAPNLRSLKIISEEDLTPLEIMFTPPPHIDFSRLPALESLALRNFQQLDPADFRHLRGLKQLNISGPCIINLDWLKDADYRLESLLVESCIEDCSGVVYQPQLRYLMLFRHWLDDISPIEKLKHLERLDLTTHNTVIKDEGNLRSMGIPQLIITRRDYELKQVRNHAQYLLNDAVKSVYAQNQHLIADSSQVNKWPPHKQNAFMRTMTMPFSDRVAREIQFNFNSYVRRIKENERYPLIIEMSREEYLAAFTRIALEYYPFITTGDNAD